MATVTVTAHHNSSWKQKNGKWVKTKKEPEYKKDLKESRKISSDIGKAFLNKTAKKSKNSHTDGKSLYLHGHEIAKHGENGAVHGTMAGWPTKTTKDRLNAISNDRFHTKKGKHYYGDKEIGERDWVQIKEAIRIMVEGAIKDLETKDEEEKRLLKTNKPKKIMIDKERSQFKGLQKKDLKEDQLEEAKKLYVRKVQGDSRTRRNKKAWDLAFNPKKPVSFFDELKAINAKKEQEKKDLKEGVLSALKNRLTGRRSKVKSDLENKSNDYSNKSFVSTLKAYAGLRVADNMFSPKGSKPGAKKIRTAAYKEYDKSLKYRKLEASAKHKAENLSKTKNYFTGKGRVDEGVGRYLDKATGNQKRRIKNKLKHQNSMVSTPLSKIATNNKRLQRLEK